MKGGLPMLQNLALACVVLAVARWAAAQEGAPLAVALAGFTRELELESHPAVILAGNF